MRIVSPIPSSFIPALLLIGLFLLGGCTGSSKVIWKEPEFTPPEPGEALYVVPFTSVLAPLDARDRIFDLVVDRLTAAEDRLDTRVVILKKDLEELDTWWLRQQTYITGEIFGYVEDRGCCSTSIRLKARAELYLPGDESPSLSAEFPRSTFFDHDYGDYTTERERLLESVGEAIAEELIDTLALQQR